MEYLKSPIIRKIIWCLLAFLIMVSIYLFGEGKDTSYIKKAVISFLNLGINPNLINLIFQEEKRLSIPAHSLSTSLTSTIWRQFIWYWQVPIFFSLQLHLHYKPNGGKSNHFCRELWKFTTRFQIFFPPSFNNFLEGIKYIKLLSTCSMHIIFY